MVPTADLREITMQVIFTAAEQQSTREFNRKLGRLLRDLPGAGDVASQLIESSYEPIDYQKLTRHLDSSQFTMQEDEAGNLVVWINPEATAAAMDLMLEQYSIVIEIDVALYPIARLAKRLIGGFAEKCVEFGQRFQRKPDAARTTSNVGPVSVRVTVTAPSPVGGVNDTEAVLSASQAVRIVLRSVSLMARHVKV